MPHRDSSATTASLEPETKHKLEDDVISQKSIIGEVTEVEITDDDNEEPPPLPRSPSIHIEDYSEKSKEPSMNGDDRQSNAGSTLHDFEDKVFGETESPFGSRKSPGTEPAESPVKRALSRASSPSPARSVKSVLSSRVSTPAPATEPYHEEPSPSDLATRDVRTALAECIVPPRHEDWEVIVNALLEIERLAADPTARAPTACWRSVVRSTAGHVRSLRSRVARTACGTIGALFEHRGRALDPELEEATNALLERCADVNKFLRADAAAALVRVACGGSSVRSAVALSRRGSTHRAGPVRAAATQALAKFVQHHGASRVLDFPSEPRTVLLRAAGDLLGDAHADTREQARLLCLALAEDMRFKPMLKESMPPTRYRAVEKYVDRLRCR